MAVLDGAFEKGHGPEVCCATPSLWSTKVSILRSLQERQSNTLSVQCFKVVRRAARTKGRCYGKESWSMEDTNMDG